MNLADQFCLSADIGAARAQLSLLGEVASHISSLLAKEEDIAAKADLAKVYQHVKNRHDRILVEITEMEEILSPKGKTEDFVLTKE